MYVFSCYSCRRARGARGDVAPHVNDRLRRAIVLDAEAEVQSDHQAPCPDEAHEQSARERDLHCEARDA